MTTVSLRDALRARARRDDCSAAEVVFGAVAAHVDHLRELAAAERPAPVASGGGALFPHPTQVRHAADEPRVAVPLRSTVGNFEVLDQLVHKADADNRSQLITAVLRAELGA